MKKAFLSTFVFVAGSYAFAAAPAPQPQPAPAAPSIVGTWSLSSAECSSGAAVNGGVKIGQDTMKATFANDQSAQFSSNIAGCDSMAKGTYKLEGSILTTTMTQSQSCKDAAPVPMNETKKTFIAYLGEKEAVTVVTGSDAAVCPAGDVLVNHYTREMKQP